MVRRQALCALVSAALAGAPVGCASDPVAYLEEVVAQEHLGDVSVSVDELLRSYLTDEAYARAKDIPLVEGVIPGDAPFYAVGVNTWSRLGALVTGSGWQRKVVMDAKIVQESCRALQTIEASDRFTQVRQMWHPLPAAFWKDREAAEWFAVVVDETAARPFVYARNRLVGGILHEYLHHLDSMGMIPRRLFKKGYAALERGGGVWTDALRDAVEEDIASRPFWYWLFMSKTSERIAEVGGRLAVRQPAIPEDLRRAYAGVLRVYSNKPRSVMVVRGEERALQE